jgi:hypothetical protein
MINRRSISWLLVVAVLGITLLPAHYHLHHLHSDDATAHTHTIDLHVIADKADQSHHDDASIFSATPDVVVKKTNPEFSPYIILAILLVLLPTYTNLLRIKADHGDLGLKRLYPYFSPLLRAPPLR